MVRGRPAKALITFSRRRDLDYIVVRGNSSDTNDKAQLVLIVATGGAPLTLSCAGCSTTHDTFRGIQLPLRRPSIGDLPPLQISLNPLKVPQTPLQDSLNLPHKPTREFRYYLVPFP